MLVHFRKRLSAVVLSEVNNSIAEKVREKQDLSKGPKALTCSENADSINQSHVRPIKSEKAETDTEFGAKINISLVDCISFADTINWDSFKESIDLIAQTESYRERSGNYTESLHVDKVYRNQENSRYFRKRVICLFAPKLGRLPKVTESNAQALKAAEQQARQDEIDRNLVEGKFGQGKWSYGFNRITTKLSCISETAIMISFLAMNLNRWLIAFVFLFFQIKRAFFSIFQSALQSYFGTLCSPANL